MREIIIIIKRRGGTGRREGERERLRHGRTHCGGRRRRAEGEKLRARLPFAVLLKWSDKAGCRNTDKRTCSLSLPESEVCAVVEVDEEGTYEALASQEIADKCV